MGPLIGVVLRPNDLKSGRSVYSINQEINTAILKNGGRTIGIVPDTSNQLSFNNTNNTYDKLSKNVIEEIKRCDGIIMQGGDHFYDYDIKIIDYCYKTDIPLLGICLGMQAMSYYFNGRLKRLNNDNHKSKQKYVHDVIIDRNSFLYQIFRQDVIKVNSRHKDNVICTDLDVVAKSFEGIIEAVEDKNKTFFIGVQWHPETMIEYDKLENNLFSSFINCCRR